MFVDGGWGTGKTHFFEHDYFLNKVGEDNDEIQEIHDKKCYKKEYISVYGKHSLKEIKEIIVTKILSYVDDDVISENLKQGISNIFKMFEVKFLNTENITASIDDYLESKARDKIKDKLNKNGGRVVFIIDDIERLNDGISLKEFLGFIRNVLLDSFNCKVIIIGNKEAITSENKNEMKNYWEKVISRNLKFPSNLEVGKKILNNDLRKSYFNENEIQDLIELIQVSPLSTSKANVLNLRTLNLVITDFKKIYDQLENCNKEHVNTRMSLFTSLFILHNINRNNVIDNQEKFKDMKVPNGFTFINSKKDKKPSPEEEIYQKYFQENEIAKKYAFFSRELNNYILEGVLDIEEYQKKLNDNFSEKNAEEDVLYILRNFMLYSEDKVKGKESEAIDIIKGGRYSFGYRLNIYMKLKELYLNGIVTLNEKEIDELEDYLLENYELQISDSIEGEDLLKLINFHFPQNPELIEYKNELSEKLMKQQKIYMKKQGIYQQYIEAILNEERKKRSELEMQYKEIKNVDIFTIFNSYISDIEKELLGNNAKIIYLNRHIYNRTDIFIETLDNIERFINNIKQIEAQNKDKIAKYNFDTLQGTLSNIRENTRIKLTEE